MARQHAEELLSKLEKSREWPPKGERKLLTDLFFYAAVREADDEYLRPDDLDSDQQWILDPIGQRVPQVWADMIFGEDPIWTHPDQKNVDFIVEENELPSEQQSGVEMSSSEGEVWWRVYKDEDLQDSPILDYHSRTTVYPYFKGRRLVAVAFISVIQEENQAWRYVEVHAEQVVVNRLYKVPMSQPAADETKRPNMPRAAKAFGNEVPLTDRQETEDIEPEWAHGLAHMLCGRVMNRRGRDPKLGVSDFKGRKGLLNSLNALANIGDGNMHLTARKRSVVDESVLSPRTITMTNGTQMTLPSPEFDAREQVFVRSDLDTTLDGDNSKPFQVLEYDFDAEALVTWSDHLTDMFLTRTRVAPQLVGRHTEDAQTGPSLRARLLDSILCSNGKARFWDDSSPDQMRASMLVDQLPTSLGGFGRKYKQIDTLPTMQRTDSLPQDELAEANTETTKLNAGITSRRRSIKKLNPTLSDVEVDEIIEEIKEDEESVAPTDPPPDPTGGGGI